MEVPMDYYNDPELALFHEIIAKETCMRTCKDREVKVIVTLGSSQITLRWG